MREKLILIAEKVVKQEIEEMTEQIKSQMANRLESILDESEHAWVNKITKDSKIKNGLQAGSDDEKTNKTLVIVANHAKSLMYIELKKLLEKFEELKHLK